MEHEIAYEITWESAWSLLLRGNFHTVATSW